MDRRQFLARAARLALGASSLSALAAIRLTQGRDFALGRQVAGAGATPEPSGSPLPTEPAAASSPVATPTPTPFVNPIVRENLRPGEGGWEIVVDAPGRAVGYFDQVSVAPGETLTLHASSPERYDVRWYRFGWYEGQGARLVREDLDLPAFAGARPWWDKYGRVECRWPAALSVEIPSDWQSGYYMAVLRPTSGSGPSYVPVVVRPTGAGRRAPVLVVSAAATWQAYNWYGGKNLYQSRSYPGTTATGARRAAIVSFDRPYGPDRGSGQFLRYEYQFARWTEREGRDVEYVTDLDLVRHPELFEGRRMVVFPGHPEYWSWEMRDTLERTIGSGTNVLFLCANEIYWQIRTDDSPLGAHRNITCYKVARTDPVAKTDPTRTTVRWRDKLVGRPEAEVVGQQYAHIVKTFGDWVVRNGDHWIYEGTGLRDGDKLPRLIGPEYDTYVRKLAPPGTLVLAEGPVASDKDVDDVATNSREVHTATIYTASSGATVFAAGTFLWSLALDGYRTPDYRKEYTPVDPRVARMTKNLFDRLGDGPKTA